MLVPNYSYDGKQDDAHIIDAGRLHGSHKRRGWIVAGQIYTNAGTKYLSGKKRLAISIYNSARMEGCKVTLHDVKVIMDGGSVCGISKDDEVTILNLRDAWRHILSRIGEPITLELINQVNGYVARDQSLEWGVLRKGEVGISGTVYKPKIPVENEVRKELNHVLEIASDTKRVIYLMLWMMRSQLYWDGNKRTAIICANHVMIRSGRGIISVPEAQLHEFNKRLTAFYETNDYSRIDRFVYDTSVEGQ